MKRSSHRTRIIAAVAVIVLLAVGASFWIQAVEAGISFELRAQAAAYLEPTLAFDGLHYRFPRTVELHGLRLTSPDPETPSGSIDIVSMDTLTLELDRVPRPRAALWVRRIDIAGPKIRLRRIASGPDGDRLLGFSDFLKQKIGSRDDRDRTPTKLSDQLRVRTISLRGGGIRYDGGDGTEDVMLIDGIDADLALEPTVVGSYALHFSLDEAPILKLRFEGVLDADDLRLEVSKLSVALDLARKNDHYLTPTLQKLFAERNLTGRVRADVQGAFDLDGPVDSWKAHLELTKGEYAHGSYGVALDRLNCRLEANAGKLTIEELGIDALGGHTRITGSVELDQQLMASLRFDASALRLEDLLRGNRNAADGRPRFSGLLAFHGTLSGPLEEIDRHAAGEGRIVISTARLALLPVLSKIDETIDRLAEATLKKESRPHDSLSLDFSLQGDHARIAKLRMNSRWYGLRGHGKLYLDSRLDMAVDGGAVPRIENEMGEVGDVLGEITETLTRARVTGTLEDPKVGIEVLRHRLF